MTALNVTIPQPLLFERGPRLGSIALGLTLVLAGLAGNYFRYPIFLNIDFLFGSIFSMLALQVFGVRRGMAAAILISSLTYILWNHPYAIVILTAEVACVGWLTGRKQIGLVLADALYWLLLGMPLVYLLYHGVMDVPLGNTTIVMVKQAVNGITNTLLARLAYSMFVLGARRGQVSYRDLIYNLLAVFGLGPALLLLMVASHRDYLATDRSIQTGLRANSELLTRRVNLWLEDRALVVTELAALARTRKPASIQSALDQALASDANLLRIGVLDLHATTVAHSPLVDELGHSNIGRHFADRPFIAALQQSLKPMLSEVVMGRIGTPRPIVTMLAPVLIHARYGGYVSGTLSLDQLQDDLEKSALGSASLYTLLDRNRNVILTNRKGQTVMALLDRGKGVLKPLDTDMAQWLASVPDNTPVSERWRSSYYVTESPIGKLAEWRLVLEQPVAPFQQVLYARYTEQLALLLATLLVALALAEFLSRKVARRTEQLSAFTKSLPMDLSRGVKPRWAESNLLEHQNLIDNFKEMADALALHFHTNQALLKSLEERVAQRTRALALSEGKYRSLIENGHDIIYTLDTNGVFTYVSAAWSTLLGHAVADVVGHSFKDFVHPDDQAACQSVLQSLLATGERQENIEYRVRHIDGSWHWHSSNVVPQRDECDVLIGAEGNATDITVRKNIHEQVHQLAFYDALTKLPNRRLLSDRMNQAMAASRRNASYGAVMFLDLDNFKPLNDTHGHDVGDLLLVEVAQRLLDCVRETDTVARFGGDEFVVMLGDLGTDKEASIAQAAVVAEKIRASLAEPYALSVYKPGAQAQVVQHRCTACIGVVVFVNHEVDHGEVLKQADAAMYQAKEAGRNQVHFCQPPIAHIN
jgi:two-component system cell cycle sensor histidine kinase/response regulator CckA